MRRTRILFSYFFLFFKVNNFDYTVLCIYVLLHILNLKVNSENTLLNFEVIVSMLSNEIQSAFFFSKP